MTPSFFFPRSTSTRATTELGHQCQSDLPPHQIVKRQPELLRAGNPRLSGRSDRGFLLNIWSGSTPEPHVAVAQNATDHIAPVSPALLGRTRGSR